MRTTFDRQKRLPVLSEGIGQDPAQRLIHLNGTRNLTISAAGEIYQGGELAGRLSLVEFPNDDALQKQGNSLYAKKEIYQGEAIPASNFEIHQGFAEMSNVNIIQEMTDMITATRAFESNQRAIKAYDKMDEKLVNEVPKTS